MASILILVCVLRDDEPTQAFAIPSSGSLTRSLSFSTLTRPAPTLPLAFWRQSRGGLALCNLTNPRSPWLVRRGVRAWPSPSYRPPLYKSSRTCSCNSISSSLLPLPPSSSCRRALICCSSPSHLLRRLVILLWVHCSTLPQGIVVEVDVNRRASYLFFHLPWSQGCRVRELTLIQTSAASFPVCFYLEEYPTHMV